MNPQLHNLRRADPRSEVSADDVRGILNRSRTGEQSSFLLWDISDRGLRMWSPVDLSTDEVLRLTIAKPAVTVFTARVCWCRRVSDHDGYQVGLQALEGHNRLEALHQMLVARPHEELGLGTLSSASRS